MTKVPGKRAEWLLLIVVNLTVPAVLTWKVHTGDASRSVAYISGAVSIVFLNAFLLAAINRRNKANGAAVPRNLTTAAIGLALLSAALTAFGVHSTPESNEYTQLAFSNTPLADIHPRQKALVVELLRRRLANSLAYEKQAAEAKPISPPVYSPESFANVNVIRSTLEQYSKLNAIDVAYRQQQEQSLSDFRDQMMKEDPAYLKSFEAGDQERATEEGNLYQLSQERAAATIALYSYAAAHTKDINVKDGQLKFASADVQTEFSRQLEKAKDLDTRAYAAFQSAAAERRKGLKEQGILPNS